MNPRANRQEGREEGRSRGQIRWRCALAGRFRNCLPSSFERAAPSRGSARAPTGVAVSGIARPRPNCSCYLAVCAAIRPEPSRVFPARIKSAMRVIRSSDFPCLEIRTTDTHFAAYTRTIRSDFKRITRSAFLNCRHNIDIETRLARVRNFRLHSAVKLFSPFFFFFFFF